MLLEKSFNSMNPSVSRFFAFAWLEHHLRVFCPQRLLVSLDCFVHFAWNRYLSAIGLFGSSRDTPLTVFVRLPLNDVTECEAYCILQTQGTFIQQANQSMDLWRMLFSYAKDLFSLVIFESLMWSDVLSIDILSQLLPEW